MQAAATPIGHVIVMLQERRSFDSFFCDYPGADGATRGYLHDGRIVPLRRVGLGTQLPIADSSATFMLDWNTGEMNGFDRALLLSGLTAGTRPYACVRREEVAAYWRLAKENVLADHMFSTAADGDFVAHQMLIAGGDSIAPGDYVTGHPNGAIWGCDAPKGTFVLTNKGERIFPCFRYPTLATLLDNRQVSWKTYAPAVTAADSGARNWNGFDAIRAVRFGPDWQRNMSRPETNVLVDIHNGTLPSVSWVIPNPADSDDPALGARGGPSWVASVAAAVRHSPYNDDTVVVVVWTGWGGLYDHAPPPLLDSRALGFRVRCW